MTTAAPASASASAVARPMPCAPPVTNATRPSRRKRSRYMLLRQERCCGHWFFLDRLVREELVDVAALAVEFGPGEAPVGREIDPYLVNAIGKLPRRILAHQPLWATGSLER